MAENIQHTLESGMLPSLLSLLEEDQVLPITPSGISMFPFFYGGRDTLYIKRPTAPLKRGDIALYRRTDTTFVVHRIHHIQKEKDVSSYYMLGDHQTLIEGPLAESQIYGVVAWYERKGKKIDCTSDKKYNLLWRLWMILRPVRPVFLKGWELLRRLLGRRD